MSWNVCVARRRSKKMIILFRWIIKVETPWWHWEGGSFFYFSVSLQRCLLWCSAFNKKKKACTTHRNQTHLLGVCTLDRSHSEMQRKPKLQKPVGDDVGSSHLFPSVDMRSLHGLTGTCMENVRGKERVEKFSPLPAGNKRRALTDILYHIFSVFILCWAALL